MPTASFDLRSKLEEWVGRGLISAEQAEAIRAAETETEPARPQRGRISFASEALGYLGAALFVGAILVAFGDVWQDFEDWTRMAALGGTTALLVVAGTALRGHEEPAFDRVTGFLWFVAVGIFSMLCYIFSQQLSRFEGETEALVFSGGVSAVLGAILWWVRRSGLQQTALFGSLTVAILSFGFTVPSVNGETLAGLLMAGFGAGWLGATERGLLAPRTVGEALGSAGTLLGMQVVGFDQQGWLFVAVVVAGALMTGGVSWDRKVPLAVGAAGLFIFVPQFITETFGGSIGAAGSIAAAGMVILAVAIFIGRTRRTD